MLDIDPHAESILHLVRQLRLEMSEEEQARLGDYAVAMRYPGDTEPVSLTEAERAVQIARRVRTQVRRRLPKAGMTPQTASSDQHSPP